MAFSRTLLALPLLLALTACSPETTTSPVAGPGASPGAGSTPGPLPASEVPAAARGTWLDSWSTSMQYGLATRAYDFETGVWFAGLPDLWDMAPDRGFGLSLQPDGSFLWVLGQDGGLGGCQSYTVEVIKGVAYFDAGVVRFHPTARRQRYESTCDPSLNMDRPLALDEFSMAYGLGATQDTGLPTLELVDESTGHRTVYFRH